MWEVIYNGDSVRNVFEIQIEENLTNPIKRAKITLLAPPEMAGQFSVGHRLDTNHLEILRYGNKLFDGFVEFTEPDESFNVHIYARSLEILLLDEISGREERYTNQIGSDIINSVLNNHSTKVIAGTINYPELLAGTMRFSHDNLFKSMAKVCNIEDKDFWTELDGNDVKLNVGIRGDGSQGSPAFVWNGGRDIIVKLNREGSHRIINRQRVLGSGDGINQIQACVPYIDIGIPDDNRSQGFNGYNPDCLHPVAEQSQIDFGIMEGRPVSDRSIVDVQTAIKVAKEYLGKYSQTYKSIDVHLNRYFNVGLGDWVRVTEPNLNVDEVTRIKKIKHRFKLGAMDRLEVELFNPFDDTQGRINAQERDSDTQNLHGMGATNIFQVSTYENCDEMNPLTLRFRLPDDIVTLNMALLSFQIQPYRAYHQGMEAGGAHSHTFTLPIYKKDTEGLTDDVYLVGLRQYFFGGNYQGQRMVHADSNRSLESQSTTEEMSHTHDIDYGIVTEPLSNPEVTVKAGGNTIGTFTDSIISDEDITQHVSTIGAWHTITFEPNQNMRIEANLYIKCYVESK